MKELTGLELLTIRLTHIQRHATDALDLLRNATEAAIDQDRVMADVSDELRIIGSTALTTQVHCSEMMVATQGYRIVVRNCDVLILENEML